MSLIQLLKEPVCKFVNEATNYASNNTGCPTGAPPLTIELLFWGSISIMVVAAVVASILSNKEAGK